MNQKSCMAGELAAPVPSPSLPGPLFDRGDRGWLLRQQQEPRTAACSAAGTPTGWSCSSVGTPGTPDAESPRGPFGSSFMTAINQTESPVRPSSEDPASAAATLAHKLAQ